MDVEALYNTYFHDVYLYLCSVSRDESLAEELTQETFFRALKSSGQFRGDCDVRVWLCQIAKNLFLNHCKKQKYLTGNEIPESEADPRVSVEEQIAVSPVFFSWIFSFGTDAEIVGPESVRKEAADYLKELSGLYTD